MIKGIVDKSIREGYFFKKKLKQLEESQFYTKEQIENYQNENLEKIIKHSYETVPYYKEVFDKNKLSINDIKCKEDLWKIPVLTKDDIKSNFKKLKSTKSSKFIKVGETSGTTGTPLKVYRDLNSIIFENAIVWRQWKWAGISLDDNIAVLRGERIIPHTTDNPPYWKYDRATKRLKLSPIHLTEITISDYIEAIAKYNCKALQAYPSTAYMLAMYCNINNIRLKLKAVFTSSEPLHPFQRELIENVFGCKVWDYYGMGERVCSASECMEHGGLHINEEYSITEFLNKYNENSEKGIITGTTLHNYSMPLIRYKTGDLGELEAKECNCTRHSRIIKPIETKVQDILITSDGRYISPVTITNMIRTCNNIKESQIIQETLNLYQVKVVKEYGFNESDRMEMKEKLQSVLGLDCKIDINIVDYIERTENGKFRMIMSKVKAGDK